MDIPNSYYVRSLNICQFKMEDGYMWAQQLYQFNRANMCEKLPCEPPLLYPTIEIMMQYNLLVAMPLWKLILFQPKRNMNLFYTFNHWFLNLSWIKFRGLLFQALNTFLYIFKSINISLHQFPPLFWYGMRAK